MEVIHPRPRGVYCRVRSPGILARAALLPLLPADNAAFPERLSATAAMRTPRFGNQRRSQAVCRATGQSHRWLQPREEAPQLKHSWGKHNFFFSFFRCWTVPPRSAGSIQEPQRERTPPCTNTK